MKASIVLHDDFKECVLSVRSETGREKLFPLRKLTETEEDQLLDGEIPQDVADMATKIITEKFTSAGLPLLVMYTAETAKIKEVRK